MCCMLVAVLTMQRSMQKVGPRQLWAKPSRYEIRSWVQLCVSQRSMPASLFNFCSCTSILQCVHTVLQHSTSDVHVSEQELGWKRSDLVISTKIFWGGPGPNDKGLSRKHLIEGTKVLFQIHQTAYIE